MRSILRRREFVADEWRYADEEPGAQSLIVPLAQLRRDSQGALASVPRLGVRLGPADAVEELVPHLARLRLVALEFPNPGDGRAFSQGYTLREQLGFTFELRAVGAGVRQDLVFFMARCGFDAFELAAGQDPQAAQRALSRYDVAYQVGSPEVKLRAQRFLRANAPAA
jgi:uncharacterized protein (DUF934 family)